MNLDSLSFALSQISYSVANLTKKNFKSSVAEISRVSRSYGAPAIVVCSVVHLGASSDRHIGGGPS